MKFGLGQAVSRTKDPRPLIGRGRYTDDLVLLRLAHAYVLRSPLAHASIRSVARGTRQPDQDTVRRYTRAAVPLCSAVFSAAEALAVMRLNAFHSSV